MRARAKAWLSLAAGRQMFSALLHDRSFPYLYISFELLILTSVVIVNLFLLYLRAAISGLTAWPLQQPDPNITHIPNLLLRTCHPSCTWGSSPVRSRSSTGMYIMVTRCLTIPCLRLTLSVFSLVSLANSERASSRQLLFPPKSPIFQEPVSSSNLGKVCIN